MKQIVKNEFIDDVIKIIDNHWRFDNNQSHTHTWHDKQNCIEALIGFFNSNIPDHTPTEQNPICPYCKKYKTLQGNSIMHQLCKCWQQNLDPYSPYAAWITPQQVYEAQQKQKNAESVDDICIKCKHHGTFDVYCDECTDTNDNYQPKTK